MTARHSKRLHLAVVRAALTRPRGTSIALIAREFKVPVPTVYRWMRQLKNRDVTGCTVARDRPCLLLDHAPDARSCITRPKNCHWRPCRLLPPLRW